MVAVLIMDCPVKIRKATRNDCAQLAELINFAGEGLPARFTVLQRWLFGTQDFLIAPGDLGRAA